MSNLIRLQAALASADVPALLISDITNVGWVSGFTGSAGIVLVTPDSARFLTDSRYTLQAKEEIADMPSFSFASPKSMGDFLVEHVSAMGIKRLGFDGACVTYDTWKQWTDKLVGVELFPAPNVIDPIRMVKNASEVARIRASCKLADAAFEHIQRLLQPGVSEYDISLEIEFFFRRQGATLAFPPIVVSGERSARPHGVPSEKKLAVGDFVTMDFGSRLDGQCSDITRTVVIGEASERHKEVYAAVLEAQLAGIAALVPGNSAKAVDAAARDLLAKHDLAQYFGHGLGHGLGGVVHDLGRLAMTSTDTIEVGQVWTIEPGVYIPGFGGVRIEDDVLVTASGPEILTSSPKHLMIFPA